MSKSYRNAEERRLKKTNVLSKSERKASRKTMGDYIAEVEDAVEDQRPWQCLCHGACQCPDDLDYCLGDEHE